MHAWNDCAKDVKLQSMNTMSYTNTTHSYSLPSHSYAMEVKFDLAKETEGNWEGNLHLQPAGNLLLRARSYIQYPRPVVTAARNLSQAADIA